MVKKGCFGFSLAKINSINGWLLKFFAYCNNYDILSKDFIKIEDFNELTSQLLIAPFTINDHYNKKENEMEYKAIFIGFDQNEKNEIFLFKGG